MKFCFAAILLVTASPALSQAAPAPPSAPATEADPAAVAAAMKFLEVQQFERDVLASTEMFTDAMMASVIQSRQEREADEEIPEAFLSELRATMRDNSVSTMRANMAEMKRKTAEIYASHMTAVELLRLAEMFSDPTIQKLREREKRMQPDLIMVGMQVMKRSEPALESKIKALVAKHLNALGDDDSSS